MPQEEYTLSVARTGRNLLPAVLTMLSKLYIVDTSLFLFQILLQAINNIDEVSLCLQNFLKRYNDEFSGEGLDLMISGHVMFHVIRLHRILSYKNR